MSTLIPQITVTDFKKLKTYQMKRLKSCEVYSDGEYLFTFVNGNLEPSGYLRLRSENMAQAANAIDGKTLEEIVNAVI